MNIIPYNLNLFEGIDVGPLNEFDELLNAIPYTELIEALNDKRKNGRNDYSNDSMFRCLIARIYFEHPTTQSLINELQRNPYLRRACRIETKVNKDGSKQLAPDNAVFTRFEQRLKEHRDLLEDIFKKLRDELKNELPDLGESLALDGKIIEAYAKRPSKKQKEDGRRDTDATYTKKTYTNHLSNGQTIEKSYTYFGYRIHLIVDTTYELPVLFRVTPANESERTVAKAMLDDDFPNWLKERALYLMADRGYDGRPLQEKIENNGIIPIIDIINHWNGDVTKQYKETDFVYNYQGAVFYITDQGKAVKAHYKGYHKASNSLRYETHPKDGVGVKRVAIKRDTDPRVFNQVGRDSLKFERLYKRRTAVERVNGRLDRDYGFELHTIRGLDKMSLYVTTSFILMLGKKKVDLQRSAHQKAA